MAFVFLENMVVYAKNSGVKICQNQQKHYHLAFYLYHSKMTIQGSI